MIYVDALHTKYVNFSQMYDLPVEKVVVPAVSVIQNSDWEGDISGVAFLKDISGFPLYFLDPFDDVVVIRYLERE